MSDTLTDAELVAGHLAGDRSALAAIYDRYADSLYDTAAAMTRHRHDAADVLQDVFVAAAERMGQLRDPHKLKPWLFAILRNEVYRRSARRGRTVATDFTDPVAEMHAPSEPADEGSAVEYEELATLVRAAAAGLDERDQLVLELSVRQGLQGDDLAAALGVSAQQGYGLVHRMRQRTERSLGAYCVARAGRKDCPELGEILRGWDGEFSVLVRKRVARHVDGCDVCERSRRTLAPFALFGAAPVLAAPPELRDRILAAAGGPQPAPPYPFEAPGGFPSLARQGRRLVAWLLGAAAVVLVGVGGAVWVLADDDASLAIDEATTTTVDAPADSAPATTLAATPSTAVETTTSAPSTAPATTSTSSTTSTTTTTVAAVAPVTPTTPPAPATATPTSTPPTTAPPTTAPPAAPTTTTTTTTTTVPAPGSLGVSAGSIDFGTTLPQARVLLSNTGGRALDWTASSGPLSFRLATTPFTFAPSAGTLAPGASVEVVVTIDRNWPAEGAVPARRITFVAAGTSATVDLTGVIARPPVIEPVQVPPTLVCSGGTNGFSWQVGITDESEPITARAVVVTPTGTQLVTPLGWDGVWYGWLLPDGDGDGAPDLGTHSWRVEATDALGNVGTLAGTTTLSVDPGAC